MKIIINQIGNASKFSEEVNSINFFNVKPLTELQKDFESKIVTIKKINKYLENNLMTRNTDEI